MTVRGQELLTSVVFLFLGLIGLYFSSRYKLEQGGQVGPGAFPTLLAAILCLFGLLQGFLALRQLAVPVREGLRLRTIIAVTIAVIVFGLAIDHIGAVLALAVRGFLAGCAD